MGHGENKDLKANIFGSENLNKKGCCRLAIAIVNHAFIDWKVKARKVLADPSNRVLIQDFLNIEEFFVSDWYKTLREFAPDYIPADILPLLNRKTNREQVLAVINNHLKSENRNNK